MVVSSALSRAPDNGAAAAREVRHATTKAPIFRRRNSSRNAVTVVVVKPKERPGKERRRFRPKGLVPLESKLHAPTMPADLVHRGELIDKLRESSAHNIVLLTAPAGYGKTSALQQWAQEDERPFTWLTLDESDNDPTTLLTYILLALGRLGHVDPALLTALSEAGTADPSVVLARLGPALWRWDPPFVLILDRADHITSPAALEVLLTVVLHLGDRCQVAMAARGPPRVPWNRLRSGRR